MSSNNSNAFEAVRNRWAHFTATGPIQSQLTPETVAVSTATVQPAQPVQTPAAVGPSSATEQPAQPVQTPAAVGTSSATEQPAQPEQTPATASSTAVVSMNVVFERIANAMERVADYLQQQMAPPAAPPAPAALQQVDVTAAPQQLPVPSTSQQIAVPTTFQQTPVPAAPQLLSFMHQPTHVPSPTHHVDLIDDVDPEKKCGVCHGECEETDTFALLECGHYPYCQQCVQVLDNSKTELHFKCPACQSYVPKTLKLNFA